MRLKDHSKPWLYASASFILFFLWIIIIGYSRVEYQNTASTDPLAMVDALVPHFWVLLSAFAILSIITLRYAPDTKWLHVILLSEIALVLFYTPFILSGFSWSPDSLWHGGIASYMPEILNGESVPLSGYARSYPFSYLTTYMVEQVSGLDVFIYTLYVYPPISIVITAVLGYVLAFRLPGPRNAFLALLLALPALHFIEPHVSPFSMGTILVLSSLVLLMVDKTSAKIVVFLLTVAMILTHPISPLTYGTFLISVVVVYEFSKRFVPALLTFSQKLHSTFSVSYSTILFLAITWLSWSVYWAIPRYRSIEYAIVKVLTLRFFGEAGYISQWTGGGGFIYSGIYILNQGIYAIFLAVALVSLLFEVAWSRFGPKTGRTKDSTEAAGTGFKRVVLALSAILYAGFSFMLFLATRDHHLLGRGLVFFILTGSMCAATYLTLRSERKWGLDARWLLTIGLILFLFVSFPIVSYSKEAYNTFTPSHGNGLSFIGTNIQLANKSISISGDQQLVPYTNLSEGLIVGETFPNLETSNPDYVVLRITSYFVVAMRYDLSFDDNRFVQFHANLTENSEYNLIYASPTFEIYAYNGPDIVLAKPGE